MREYKASGMASMLAGSLSYRPSVLSWQVVKRPSLWTIVTAWQIVRLCMQAFNLETGIVSIAPRMAKLIHLHISVLRTMAVALRRGRYVRRK